MECDGVVFCAVLNNNINAASKVVLASEEKDSVADFLGLVRAEKWSQAADQYVKLVDQIGGGPLLFLAKEQELQLKPTKAFKKLTKLMRNEEAVRGVLSIPLKSQKDTLPVLRALFKLAAAPGFGAQIAKCDAASFLCQYGDVLFPPISSSCPRYSRLPGEAFLFEIVDLVLRTASFLLDFGGAPFLESALQQSLLRQLVSSLPWGGALSVQHFSGDLYGVTTLALDAASLFTDFIDSPQRIDRVLKEGPVDEFAHWLVRFLGFVGDLVTVLKGAGVARVEQDAQRCALLLLHHINIRNMAQALFSSPVASELEREVRKLQPKLLGEARDQAGFVLRNLDRFRDKFGPNPAQAKQAQAQPSQATRDANMASAKKVLERIKSGSGKELSVAVDLLPGFTRGVGYPDLAELAKLGGAKSLGEALARELQGWSLGRGHVAPQTLVIMLDQCSIQLGAAAGWGTCPPEKFGEWDKLWEAVVSLIEKRPDRSTEGLAWHLIAVLAGVHPRVDGDALVPEGTFVRVFRRPFTPLSQPEVAPKAENLAEEQRARVARLALARVAQGGPEPQIVPKDQIDDAILVLNWCCERPGVLPGEVLGQTDMLFSLLKACFFQLQESRAIGNLTGEASQEQVAMWVCVTGALTVVLRCLDSSPANRKKILGEMARNGGALLCRAVFKERRGGLGFFSTSLPPKDATSSRLGHEGSQSPGAELLGLVDELWADLAPKSNLKECSNPECVQDVVETMKKTFKKCSACTSVQYCSRPCQVLHWKGGHKLECQKNAVPRTE